MNQLSFFEPISSGRVGPPQKTGAAKPDRADRNGADLRDKGMKRAAEHAEEVSGGWQRKALNFLRGYALVHDTFSAEMVRHASRPLVPHPPSLRAWGTVLHEAAKLGWITQVGFVHVQNPKAHRANAALWKSNHILGEP